MSLEEDQVRELGYRIVDFRSLEDSVRKELKEFSADEYLRGVTFVKENAVVVGPSFFKMFSLKPPHSERDLKQEFLLYQPYGVATGDITEAMDANLQERDLPHDSLEKIRGLGENSFWQGYNFMKKVVRGKVGPFNEGRLNELLTQYAER